MMHKVLAFALILSFASAAVIPPPASVCPRNSGRLLLSTAGVTNIGTFIPNVFTYQGGGQPLMAGVPQGPWISIRDGQSSYFIENSTLSAIFDIYSSPSRLPSELIGTGTLSSTNMAIVKSGSNNFFGGDITVTTNIPSSPFPDASDVSHINFRSRTTTFHYRAQQEMPADGSSPAVANVIRFSSNVQNQESGSMTMWGGNGWNGQTFANIDAGFDLSMTFSCPNNPPIIVPCTSCNSASSNFVVPSSCISPARTLRYHSSETCITMSFTQSSDPSSGSGCGIAA
jgi:hypothetical protein